MTLKVQQQRQQHSGERSSSSWYERNIKNKRNNSAPSQQRTTTTRSVPDAHQQRKHLNTSHRQDSAATTTPVVGTASSAPYADGDAGGSLGFPVPTFSPALKLVDNDSFTLISRTTGRSWRAIKSCQECQFGEVLRAVELLSETAAPPAYFAIKELSLDKLREMQGRTQEDPLREVAALQYLPRHPNVLNCTEALWDEESIFIVTPFYSGGEVFDVLAEKGRFKECEARQLFRQVLHSLLHLKRHGVCHRDVSLENLLLAEGGVVKLVDFGLALRIPQTADGRARILPAQGPCGKRFYMAPELVASSCPSGFDGFAVDVWACGIMLFAMLTGVLPFELALPSQDQRFDIIAVQERLADLLSAWNISLSPEVTDLIQSCLRYAPERRPSLEMLLDHDWIIA